MADYPSVGLKYSSTPVVEQALDVSEGGNIRGVNLNQTTVYRLNISHPYITTTELQTLRDFYEANRINNISITLGGVVYSARFERDYAIKSESATYFTCTTVLYGVDTGDWILLSGSWSDDGIWSDSATWADS